MASSTTPTRPMRAASTRSGVCTSGLTGRRRDVTRPGRGSGGATSIHVILDSGSDAKQTICIMAMRRQCQIHAVSIPQGKVCAYCMCQMRHERLINAHIENKQVRYSSSYSSGSRSSHATTFIIR